MKKHRIFALVVAVFAALSLAPFAQADHLGDIDEKLYVALSERTQLPPAVDLEKLLPCGETFAFVKAKKLAATKASVEKDAYFAKVHEKVSRPVIDAVFAKKFGEKEARALAEISAAWWDKRFFGTFRGEALLALVAVPAEEGDVAAVFIADGGEYFSLRKAQTLLRETGAEISAVPAIAGVPAKKCGDFLFAVLGRTLFLSPSRSALEKTLGVERRFGEGGLGDSPAFWKARVRVGGSDLWFYVDGATVAKKVYAAAEKYDEEQAKELEKNPGKAMFALWAEPVVKELAPEAIDAFWGGFFYDENGVLRSQSTLAWNADRGLVRLLTQAMRDGMNKPAFFPLRDDILDVSTANFSVGEAVLQLMEIGRRATPLFALVDMQLGQLKMTQGTDVPAMLKNLSGGIATYSLYSDAGTGEKSVVLIDVADRALAKKTLEKANEFMRGNGWDIFVPAAELEAIPGVSAAFFVSNTDSAQKLAVALIGNRVCLGDAGTVRLLADAAAKPPAKSFWDSAAVKSAEALLPKGGCGVSWWHVGRSLSSVLDELKLLAGTVQDALGEEFAEALGAVKISPEDFDYIGISKTYLGANELGSRTALVPADGNADGE